MTEITLSVWAFIGQVITGISVGAFAIVAIFRYLAKSWLQHELAKSLEAAKSEISLLSARRLKLHDKEYVVFPELWAKLNKSLNGLTRVMISFRQVPNLDQMDAKAFLEWIGKSDLSDRERSYLTGEKDKLTAYNKILDLRDLESARQDYLDFHIYLQNNRIFLRPSLKTKLNEIDNLIWRSWGFKKMDFDGIDHGESFEKAFELLNKNIKPLMNEIEDLVQSQIFPEKH